MGVDRLDKACVRVNLMGVSAIRFPAPGQASGRAMLRQVCLLEPEERHGTQ